jgi:hypothetical protein
MVAFAKNYDGLCLQLKSELYAELPQPLKKEVDRLCLSIETLLASGKPLGLLSPEVLDHVFSFRLMALKWLSQNQDLDLRFVLEDVFPEVQKWKSDPEFEVLCENVLFALRCNLKVINALVKAPANSEQGWSTDFSGIGDLSYARVIDSISFTNLGSAQTKNIIEWFNASLYIEFGLVASDIVVKSKGKFPRETIDELASFVAKAGQEYYALAMSLGILKKRLLSNPEPDFNHEPDLHQEETELANLGLADFEANISKD